MKCLTVLGFATVLLQAAFGQVGPGPVGYAISTIAGGGPPDGLAATSIALSDVSGIAVDTFGNLYVPSRTQNRVYKVGANGTVSTVAGNGTIGYSGDNGPASSAQLAGPQGVAVDSAGNLYIADSGNCVIRRVSGGVIATVAGTGNSCFYPGDFGLPATSAPIGPAIGVAVDSVGNLYIASFARVLKVTGGVIATVAGTGTSGYSGDNGPATSAQISYGGVAVDNAGNFYIADSANARIRRVSGGVITTVAGTGTFGYSGDGGAAVGAQISNANGVAVDSVGNLYIADTNNARIRKVFGGAITTVVGSTYGYSGDGGLATNAQISSPSGVAVDSGGNNLYIADQFNYRIRRVSGGLIDTVAGNGSFEYSGDNGPATSAQFRPAAIAASGAGNLYIADSPDLRIRRVAGGFIDTVAGNGTPGFSGDNGPATNAQIGGASGIAVDALGNQYIADSGNARIRKVSGGVITTVAGNGLCCSYSGDGGPATSASLGQMVGIAADISGTIYLLDQSSSRVRKISGGIITLVAGGGPPDGSAATSVSISGQKTAVDLAGNVYVAAASQHRVYKVATNGTLTTVVGNGTSGYSGDGGPATSAQVNYPSGVALDGAGNLYIADGGNCRIRRASGGVITTVAGTGNCDYSGDGGLATNAAISFAQGVTVDSAGNLYIADGGNCRIRRVSSGVITTVAGTGICGYSGDSVPAASAQINYPNGVAVDGLGSLYIADRNNSRIRRVSGGVITTVAGTGDFSYSGDGGPATSAQINSPSDVAVDGVGNLYIADSNNARIRRVSGGLINTVAGTGDFGYSGEGGLATNAAVGFVQGVTAGGGGNLYIADGNARIRKVSGGFITTIAGNGSNSYSGDGGPAVNAQLSFPSALAADNSGNLYISDTGNGRVRVVSAGGTITTLAGGGTQSPGDFGPATSAALSPSGLAVDGAHNVYVVDRSLPALRKVSAGGVITTIATITTIPNIGSFPFGGDAGVAVDSSGSIYLSDSVNARVQLIVPIPILGIGKTHTGNFSQGQNGATYSVAVSNAAGAGPTRGTVTVTEAVPSGMTLVSMTGRAWTCPAGGTTCTRSDVLAAGASYPPITVTVNVASNAASPLVNQVSVSGGGSASSSTSDPTTIVDVRAAIISPAQGSTFGGSSVTFNWDAGTGIAQYHLYVGVSGVGSNDICSQNTGTTLSYTCNGIPTDGRTIYVRLWSLTGPGWLYRDYTYHAVTMDPRPAMITPAPGTTLSGSSVTFFWDTGTGVAQYHLYVGVSGVGSNDICSQNTGIVQSYTCNGIPTDGRTIYVRLWSLTGPGWLYRDYTYTAAAISPLAAIISPVAGTTLSGASVTFNWDTGTGVAQYHLYVGTSGAGSNNICSQNTGSTLSYTCNGIPTDGSTIYVRMWSLTGPGWLYRDYTYTASISPLAAITSPVPGTTLSGASVTFNWDTGTGVAQYHLYVGTIGVGSTDLFSLNTGTSRTQLVTGLPTDGRTVYVRLWSLTGPGWLYRDYTYTAAAISPLAAITSPVPGTTLSGASVTFNWDTGTGVAQYHLYVGTSGAGSNNICSQNTGSTLSYTCNGIPTDGSTIYVRMWSLTGPGWQWRDYTYTAAAISPLAAMTSPVPGTTLSGASVTFNWDTGTGVAQYHLYVGTSGAGSTDLFSLNTGSSRTQLVTGLPTDGRTVYVRLWSLFAAGWQWHDYTYTAAHP